MTGLTDYLTECRWEDIFITWYVLVDDAYQAICRQTGRLRQRGPEPDFSDSDDHHRLDHRGLLPWQ